MELTKLRKSILKFVMLLMLMIMSANLVEVYATMGAPDLNQISIEVDKVKTDIIDIVNAVIAIVMFIAMIGVIYMLATKSERSKEALIGWFAALVFWGLAYLVLA